MPAVIQQTELREFLRIAWQTKNPGLLSWLIPSVQSFYHSDEAIERLEGIIQGFDGLPHSTRIQALHQLAELLPGYRFGPFAQRLFFRSGEVALRLELIRLLGKTDNWIPFLWSIAEGRGVAEDPGEEKILLRLEAFRALARWQVVEMLPVLFRFLGTESLVDRVYLEVQELLRYFDRRAYSPLTACLTSTDPRVRWVVIPALARMGPDGQQAVFGLLRDPQQEIREKALLELVSIGAVEPGLAAGEIEPNDYRLHNIVGAYRISLGIQGDAFHWEGYADRPLLNILTRTEPGMAWLIRSVQGDSSEERRLIDALGTVSDIYPHRDLWLLLETHQFPPGSWLVMVGSQFLQEHIIPLLDTRPDLFVSLVDNGVPLYGNHLRPHIHLLRRWLLEGDEPLRRAVLRSLPGLGEEALPLIESLVGTRSEQLAFEVVNVLRQISSPATPRFLEPFLDFPSIRVQTLSRLAFLEYCERYSLKMLWLSR